MPIPGPQSFIIVGTDGTITYQFDGQINADGIDLPASISPTTPARSNRIRWILESTGRVAGDIYAYWVGNSGGLEHRSFDDTDTDRIARINTFIAPGVASVNANAQYDGTVKSTTVIDNAGASSFIQLLGGAAISSIAWGIVDVNGNKLAGSNGWSGTRVGVGMVDITFSPAMTAPPAVIAMVGGQPGPLVCKQRDSTSVTATSYKNTVFNTATTAANDAAFFFIAISGT